MKKLLEGIDLTDSGIDSAIDKTREFLDRERPAIKRGIRSVESDVGNALKTLFNLAAGDDENDTERDLLKKYLG